LVLKICPGSGKTILKISIGERFDPDDLVFPRSMDEIPIASVDSHMSDPVPVLAEEKNQVASIEAFLRNRGTGSELGKGRPGKTQPDKVINSHGQAAAVESLFCCETSPPVGKPKKAVRTGDDLFPNRFEARLLGLAYGKSFRAHDEVFLDETSLPEAFGILLGGRSGKVVPQPDFVQSGFMFKIIGTQVFGIQ
jgi:hypothetical protein